MTIRWTHQAPTSRMGRFGGGWQWKVGFQADAGLRTVIFSLLVGELRIDR